ncbi:MAG: hypothetical protein AB7Y46_09630 [Armatimonadota bacterium]
MDEAAMDRPQTKLVRPVHLPAHVSELWKERYLRPICQWLPRALATYQVWGERPDCGHFFGGNYWYGFDTAQPAFILAVVYRAATQLGYDIGIEPDVLLTRATGGIRYLGFTHASGPEGLIRPEGRNAVVAGRKWGGAGEPFFMASQTSTAVVGMGMAAWLLWEQLDEETRQLAANVAEWYADAWSYERDAPEFIRRLDFWRGEKDPKVGAYANTATEENGWTAWGVDFATCLLPGHPHEHRWRSSADIWAANICMTPYDVDRNADPLQGATVREWAAGVTTHPDYTVENHGYINPGYASAGIGFSGSIALQHALAQTDVPEVVWFNRPPVYDTLKRMAEADGAFLGVQGVSWHYLSHYGNALIHAFMSVLFSDPQAAYLERCCTARALQVMDSLGGGRLFVRRPEALWMTSTESFQDAEFGAMAAYARAFLLHWALGDGAEPCSEEDFRSWQRGVHVFHNGGLALRKGSRSTASFSWRSRPSVLVQPVQGSWAIAPDPYSLSGRLACDPPYEPLFGGADGMRHRAHHLKEDGEGCAAVAEVERQGGRVIQTYALVVPDEELAIFFDHAVAAQEVVVVEQRSGYVTVRNEDYQRIPHLAPGRRVLHTAAGEFTSVPRTDGENEWFHTDCSAWANVDDAIGYVIFGSKGLAYQARHQHAKYLGSADYLILSYSNEPRRYLAGEIISSLAVAIFPNQSSAETRERPATVLRAGPSDLADAVLTPTHLAVVNFAHKPVVCELDFAAEGWGMLPVPEGCSVRWDGRYRCRAALAKLSAEWRPCRLRVAAEGAWQAMAAPTGELHLKSLSDRPLVLDVERDGIRERVELAPGRIHELRG